MKTNHGFIDSEFMKICHEQFIRHKMSFVTIGMNRLLYSMASYQILPIMDRCSWSHDHNLEKGSVLARECFGFLQEKVNFEK